MTFKQPPNLQNSPYFDDFNEDKEFLQILFKPGYAVQARELTQLQTILQNQISKVSDHLFVDGTKVFGGATSVGTYFFARVKKNSIKDSFGVSLTELPAKQYFYNTYTENYKSFVPSQVTLNSKTYTERGSQIPANDIANLDEDFQIQLIDMFEATVGEDIILIFKFLKGSLEKLNKFTINSTNILRLKEVTTGDQGNYESIRAIKPPNNPSQNPITFEFIPKVFVNGITYIENFNTCLVAFIDEGIFYKDGRFIKNPKTQIPLYKVAELLPNQKIEIEKTMNDGVGVLFQNILTERKLFSYQSKRIGFNVVVQNINFVDDSSLLDNASGFANARAPGADRLKYTLLPTQLPFDENNISHFDGTNFIEIARVKKGILLFTRENTEYSEILKLFARRTYDESGSYTVRPFQLEFREHLRQDEFTLSFGTGYDFSQVEIGDLLFKTVHAVNGEDADASTRMLNLISPTDPNDGSKKYPMDYTTEPIGQIKSIGSNKLVVTPLNATSFSTMLLNTAISIKKLDGGIIINIGNLDNTDTAISYSYDKDGVYLLSDEERGRSDKFVCLLGQGKGYVEGFEIDITSPVRLTANKARSTLSTTSNINVLLENQVLLQANSSTLFPTSSIDDNIAEEQLTIRAGQVLVQIDFTGIPLSGTATAEIAHVSPFSKTSTIQTYITNGNISHANRETVLLCYDSQSAPVL